MPVWTLAAKDLRLLVRDPRAAVILLLMPLVLILVLGLSLGEGVFEKPDDRLRVSIVNRDEGLPSDAGDFPGRPWSEVVIEDLSTTADVRVELIDSVDEARELARRGERPVVLVFGPDFSRRMHACSFLSSEGAVNPFFRDGIDLSTLGVDLIRDPTQTIGSAVIEQVAQVSMLRVVMPWMIGRAFETVAETVPFAAPTIKRMFSRYDLTAKTWAALTRSEETGGNRQDAALTVYQRRAEGGFLDRGAKRYQHLVPTYAVTFAFFLVLTTGWLFVAERRQGTMARLKMAPVARWQVLAGKLVPCLCVALFQGAFLFLAGWLVFGMDLGARPLWLVAVVGATAFAATGLAMLTAGFAKTETQVAIYGTLLVLVMAGVSGSLMPRELMPEQMRQISQITPHAWALDAYRQLLVNPSPDAAIVFQACAVLLGFGAGFLALAWAVIRLE